MARAELTLGPLPTRESPSTRGASELRPPRRAEAELRLEGMVQDHFDGLWRFMRQLGLPECDVDDGIQEVLVVCARRLTEIQTGCERSFLFSTALRVASTLRRSRKRRREQTDDTLEAFQDPCDGPEASLEARRARALLDAVLDRMVTDLRAVFVLYEIEELRMADIADLLAVPPGTVASRLRRARQQFERQVRAVEAKLARRGPS
jgi:RNA polymerase sigma-70 factor, ECF subfamily